MAAPPISHLTSLATSSPSSSLSNLTFPNGLDPSTMNFTMPSPQFGSSTSAIATAPAAGMSTPPPTATAQYLQMPATQSTWPSQWPGSQLNGTPQAGGSQMLPTQFTYQQAPQQPPRMDPGYPGMGGQPRFGIDAAAAFAGPYPPGVYQLAQPAKMPRKDYHRLDGMPINKVRGDGRKCRKVYGMENKDKWCTQCRWKKACVRFVD